MILSHNEDAFIEWVRNGMAAKAYGIETLMDALIWAASQTKDQNRYGGNITIKYMKR